MLRRVLYVYYRWRVPRRMMDQIPPDMQDSELVGTMIDAIGLEMADLWARVTAAVWRKRLTGWMS